MKLKKLYAVLCATALTFTLAGCSGGEKKEESKAPAVKVMEGDKLAGIEKDDKEKEKYLVIDVRTPEEYKEGHVKHAVNIPLEKISENIEKISAWKEKEVVTYCNTGKKSQKAAEQLIKAGFKNVSNAKGVKEFKYDLVKYNNILAADFQKVIDSTEKVYLFDARDKKDYDEKHIKDAVLVNAKELDKLAEVLPKEKDAKIYTYCYSGNRSAVIAKKATELGYTNVTNVLDGTKEHQYKF